MSNTKKVLESELLARKAGLIEYANELRKLLLSILFPFRPDVQIIHEDHDGIIYKIGSRGDWHPLKIEV